MSGHNRAKFVVYQDGGKYWWKMIVRGKVVAHAARGTAKRHDAHRAIDSLATQIPSAQVVDE